MYFDEIKNEPEMFHPYVDFNHYNSENDPTGQQVWDNIQAAIETNFAIHANPWIRAHHKNAKHLRACVDLLEEVGNDAHKHVVSTLKGHPGYDTIDLKGIPQALLNEFISDGWFLYDLTDRHELDWIYAYNYDEVCQIDIIGSNYNGVIAAKNEIQDRIQVLARGGRTYTADDGSMESTRWNRHYQKWSNWEKNAPYNSNQVQDQMYNFWLIEEKRERNILRWIIPNGQQMPPKMDIQVDHWADSYEDDQYDESWNHFNCPQCSGYGHECRECQRKMEDRSRQFNSGW
jgi:hypothetical protein